MERFLLVSPREEMFFFLTKTQSSFLTIQSVWNFSAIILVSFSAVMWDAQPKLIQLYNFQNYTDIIFWDHLVRDWLPKEKKKRKIILLFLESKFDLFI